MQVPHETNDEIHNANKEDNGEDYQIQHKKEIDTSEHGVAFQ